jgi:transposase
VIDTDEEIARLRGQLEVSQSANRKLLALVGDLANRVEDLTRELGKNSSNSAKPPSSDALADRRNIRKAKPPSGRKRGGQPGHKGSCRALLPAERVDAVVNLFPGPCDVCCALPPHVPCSDPVRHQVVDLLESGCRFTTEYRRHHAECVCGEHLEVEADRVPASAFGPRLVAAVSAMSGAYQLSRRQVPVFLKDVFGIEMSLGSVSNIEGRMTRALAAPSDEAMESAELASVKHVDETSWLRDSARCSAWVFATAMVTVIRVAADGKRATLRKLLRHSRGTLVSDRATAFMYWDMKRRQICWSHLSRLFVGFSERDGPAAGYGNELCDYAGLVFHYWRTYRAEQLSRVAFERYMAAVRVGVRACLDRAAAAEIGYVSGSCANLLEHWDAMWRFVDSSGVEPTNNHAERELRRLVLWRKRCFGSQSERGDRFVERMLTVAHTLRKQGRRTLDFLHASIVAMLEGTRAPSLLRA